LPLVSGVAGWGRHDAVQHTVFSTLRPPSYESQIDHNVSVRDPPEPGSDRTRSTCAASICISRSRRWVMGASGAGSVSCTDSPVGTCVTCRRTLLSRRYHVSIRRSLGFTVYPLAPRFWARVRLATTSTCVTRGEAGAFSTPGTDLGRQRQRTN
jgi:hypothetical protein